MKRVVCLLFGLGTLLHTALGAAESYPNQAIRMIVPFAAGGPSDVLARTYAEGLTKELGQTVVVENKPGAGGNIGSSYVAKSDPDGYSVVLGMVGTHAINQSLYPNMPHDVIKDFTPIALVGSAPIVLVAHPDTGLKNLQEVLTQARNAPGKLKFASPGAGTPQHLTGELLKHEAKLTLDHIPYRGGAPALNDVLGGHVPLGIVSLPAALPHIRNGKLFAIGLASAKRSDIAPDIPTIAEQGLTGFDVENWYGILAPANTSPEIVATLNQALGRIATNPATRERLSGAGFTALHNKADEFEQYQRDEVARWHQVISAAGITVE